MKSAVIDIAVYAIKTFHSLASNSVSCEIGCDVDDNRYFMPSICSVLVGEESTRSQASLQRRQWFASASLAWASNRVGLIRGVIRAGIGEEHEQAQACEPSLGFQNMSLLSRLCFFFSSLAGSKYSD